MQYFKECVLDEINWQHTSFHFCFMLLKMFVTQWDWGRYY